MPGRWCACIIFSAFTALDHPAGRTAAVRSLRRTTRAGWLALRIVAAVALFTGHWITGESMAVAFAAIVKKIQA